VVDLAPPCSFLCATSVIRAPEFKKDTLMPNNKSEQITALGSTYLAKLVMRFDNWRDFVAFSKVDKKIKTLLSNPTTENAIWRHYYNHRFPGLPLPNDLSEKQYKEAFIVRHEIYKNAKKDGLLRN
jgi:hypothetical protein